MSSLPQTRPPHRHRRPSPHLSPRRRCRSSHPRSLLVSPAARRACFMCSRPWTPRKAHGAHGHRHHHNRQPPRPPQLPPPRAAAPRWRAFHAGCARELEVTFSLRHVCPDRCVWWSAQYPGRAARGKAAPSAQRNPREQVPDPAHVSSRPQQPPQQPRRRPGSFARTTGITFGVASLLPAAAKPPKRSFGRGGSGSGGESSSSSVSSASGSGDPRMLADTQRTCSLFWPFVSHGRFACDIGI